MPYSPKEYNELKSVSLPHTTSWGFEIDKIEGKCPDCNEVLSGIKMSVSEYKNYCVVRLVGVCMVCSVVVTCRPIKITKDRKVYCLFDNRWYCIKADILASLKASLKTLVNLKRWFRNPFAKHRG